MKQLLLLCIWFPRRCGDHLEWVWPAKRPQASCCKEWMMWNVSVNESCVGARPWWWYWSFTQNGLFIRHSYAEMVTNKLGKPRRSTVSSRRKCFHLQYVWQMGLLSSDVAAEQPKFLPLLMVPVMISKAYLSYWKCKRSKRDEKSRIGNRHLCMNCRFLKWRLLSLCTMENSQKSSRW